jgi:hypothetical protein
MLNIFKREVIYIDPNNKAAVALHRRVLIAKIAVQLVILALILAFAWSH